MIHMCESHKRIIAAASSYKKAVAVMRCSNHSSLPEHMKLDSTQQFPQLCTECFCTAYTGLPAMHVPVAAWLDCVTVRS
jgi:hypothetical protein